MRNLPKTENVTSSSRSCKVPQVVGILAQTDTTSHHSCLAYGCLLRCALSQANAPLALALSLWWHCNGHSGSTPQARAEGRMNIKRAFVVSLCRVVYWRQILGNMIWSSLGGGVGGVKRPAEGSKEEPSGKKNLPVIAKPLPFKVVVENRPPLASTVTPPSGRSPNRPCAADKVMLVYSVQVSFRWLILTSCILQRWGCRRGQFTVLTRKVIVKSKTFGFGIPFSQYAFINTPENKQPSA